MAYTRKNVYGFGADWPDELLWYARAVKDMQSRPLTDRTSWRFYGAIHGFDADAWGQWGYLSRGEALPSSADVAAFWQQCQHGSWYFLPWHRGYLIAFETNVRATIAKLGGDAAAQSWALPYWNYFNAGQSALPPAFASQQWPDGSGNPLFVAQRNGPQGDGNVKVDFNLVTLQGMTDPQFVGAALGASVGFGGPDTGFEHGGTYHGGLEAEPHDMAHVSIGGPDANPGLMSDPDTAALDPVFWLHHANIDRLWEVWHQNPPSGADPSDAQWTAGPASVGQRAFAMPMPDGTTWTYTPADMQNLATLSYTYDDFGPAVSPQTSAERLVALGVAPATATSPQAVGASMSKNVELVGASEGAIPISGAEARTAVKLDAAVHRKVAASLLAANVGGAPDRVFLNVENVRAKTDGAALRVYVGVPDGDDPAAHPELLAGTIGVFGVRKASLRDGKHAGDGITYVFDVTRIVDALHLQNRFDVGSLPVRIVPVVPVPDSTQLSIGRVSIYREGR